MSDPTFPDMPFDLQARLDAAGVTDSESLRHALDADLQLRRDFEAFLAAHQDEIAQAQIAQLLTIFLAIPDSRALAEFWRRVPLALKDIFITAVESRIGQAEQHSESDLAAALRQRLEGVRELHSERTAAAERRASTDQPLFDFLNAQSLEDLQRLVAEHPQLLDDTFEPLFANLREQYMENEDALALIEARHELLQAFREQGVETVIEELRRVSEQMQQRERFQRALTRYADLGLAAQDSEHDVSAWQAAVDAGEMLLAPEFAETPGINWDALRESLASAYSNLGNVLGTAGNKILALDAFDRAIELQPDFAMWHHNRARTLNDMGRVDEAVAAIVIASASEPHTPQPTELDHMLREGDSQDSETAMSTSMSRIDTLTCLDCHQPFTFEQWCIVDVVERPDLLDRIVSGSLHSVACPHCGKGEGHLDTSLLIYHPGSDPAIIYLPNRNADPEEARSERNLLLQVLRLRLGANWDESLLATPPPTVTPSQLRLLLTNDPVVALQTDLNQAEMRLEMAKSTTNEDVAMLELQVLIRRIAIIIYQYETTHDERLLSSLQADWEDILAHQGFDSLDPPTKSKMFNQAAHSYILSFEQHRTSNHLERAINLWSSALTLLPAGAQWPSLLICLGSGYRDRFGFSDDPNDLELAWQYYVRAHEQNEEFDPWDLCYEVGVSLHQHGASSGAQAELERAVVLLQSLVVHTPQDHQHLHSYLNSYGITLYTRFLLNHSRADLDESVMVLQRSLGCAPADFPQLAKTLHNLGNSLYKRYKVDSNLQDLDDAVEIFTEAIRRDLYSYQLGYDVIQAVLVRYVNRGDPNDLEQIAETIHSVLRWSAEQVEERKSEQNILAEVLALFEREIRSLQRHNHSFEITAWRRLVSEFSLNRYPLLWAWAQLYIGRCLREIDQGDLAQTRDEAIATIQQAVDSFQSQGETELWADSLIDLAIAYMERIAGNTEENIERAIQLCEQALEAINNRDQPQIASRACMELAIGTRMRHRGEVAENIEQAIAYELQAIDIQRHAGIEFYRPLLLRNVAVHYLHRMRGPRAENIEQAIAYLDEALALESSQSSPVKLADILTSIAMAYRQRLYGDRTENIERALAYSRQAVNLLSPADEPVAWADAMSDLAYGYRDRVQGDAAENIEQAINCQRAALGKLSAKHHTSVWAEAMVNLGRLLAQQLRGDEAENIEQAIACHLQVLEVTSPQSYSRERAGALKALGEAYSQRIYGDRNQNIDQAIEYLHQALEAATRDLHPFDWSDTITHLAKVYAERPTGDLSENIDHAIRLLHEALEVVSPETHLRQWASIMLILPKLYHDYPRGSRAENIEQGITYCQQVLERVSRENQPDIWIEATQMLASCYSDIVFRDRRENREKAIQLYHAALELCSPEARPTQWVSVLHNLSATYIVTSNTHPERIDLAIDGFRQVLSVFTRERSPATWAKTLDSLGDAYIARVTGDRAENIEQGIAYYLQALEVRTREAFPTEWALTMKALGIAYSDREQGGRIENAEKSIAFYRNAMEVFTRKRGPFEWADLMHRLGTAISHRLLGNPADNIEEAIRYFLQALEVFNREEFPYDWSAAIYNLGICFLERIQGDPSENNEQAIRYFQQALEVRTREVHPVEWGQTMYELGIAYLQRVQGDRSENLERAIAYFEQGLTVRTVNQAPERWVQTMQRLITAYLQRGLNGDNQRVIELCEATLVIARPQSLPSAAQWLAQLLGYLRFRQSQWPEATEAFQRALQATDVLYRSSLLRESKQLELARVKHLYTYSAYAAARAGALHEATVILEQGRARGLSEALARDQAYLEQIRIVAPDVFADYIDAAGGVQQVEVVERRTFAQTTEVTTPILDASFLDRAHAAHANLERAMARVRQVPGFETFLAGVSWEDIAAAAQSNQPIAYLATTSAGTIVIIVHGDRSEPGVLWVDSFTSDLLDKLIANGRDEQIADGYLYGQLSGLGLADALDKLLPRLGEQLIGPLAEYLRAIGIPGVILIPCGLLGLLPLHAARYRVANKDLCLLDELDVAYVPSARTLATATISLRQRTAGPTHLSGVANPLPDTVICSQAHTYLVQLSPELPRLAEQVKEQLQLAIDASSDVTPLEAKPALREMTALVDRFVDGLRQIAGASPDSVLHSGHILNGAAVLFALSADPAAMALQEFAGQIPPNLSYARAELESIRDLLPPDATTVLSEANASRDALWAALPAATIVHFACHGQFDAHTPLDSALLLAGGSRLTLRDLLDADRTQTERLRLAVLSACQTAIYDFRYLPDESIGMFAGFLQAGIPAVIGTLWPVDDLSTALLMTRFYELYLRGDMLSQRQATPMSPVTALRMAQLWLRDLTYQQLDKYLQHHRELKHAEETSTSRMSWVLLEQGLRRTRRAMQADAGDKRPFVDPKYWAGFVYYGAL